MSEENSNKDKSNEKISLSAALLAPINSIFEAQIHSARAFLSFILQMGFRHTPSRDDFEDQDLYNSHIEDLRIAKNEMKELFRDRNRDGHLSAAKTARLKELSANYGDLYHQSIDFIDNTGNEFQVSIPNLALLPIKPLAISEADFSYEFVVDSETETFNQNGAALKSEGGKKENPWFLIKPKSLRGSIAERKEDSEHRAIKINVKVGNTEMPYGLEKLLVHLTNSIDSIDKKDD